MRSTIVSVLAIAGSAMAAVQWGEPHPDDCTDAPAMAESSAPAYSGYPASEAAWSSAPAWSSVPAEPSSESSWGPPAYPSVSGSAPPYPMPSGWSSAIVYATGTAPVYATGTGWAVPPTYTAPVYATGTGAPAAPPASSEAPAPSYVPATGSASTLGLGLTGSIIGMVAALLF